MSTTARVEIADDRPGLNIAMYDGVAPTVSPAWSLAGWTIAFVRLDPHQRFPLDQSAGAVHVKVVTGHLEEGNLAAYATPRVVRATRITADQVTAGAEGALFAVLVETPAAPERITSMAQLDFEGPHAELLTWATFEERYHAVTPFFDGVDAHMAPGWHLLDSVGAEIAYVWVWTAGKGVDLSTHDHGRAPGPRNPAFAEVHWVLYNGTGSGGMYETPVPDAPTRTRYPIPQGAEHGPFFRHDTVTGVPAQRENGAVDYPWHGWQAGTDDSAGQAYDVVIPFEITVPYAHVTS